MGWRTELAPLNGLSSGDQFDAGQSEGETGACEFERRPREHPVRNGKWKSKNKEGDASCSKLTPRVKRNHHLTSVSNYEREDTSIVCNNFSGHEKKKVERIQRLLK